MQYLPADKPFSSSHFLSTQYIDSIRFQNGQIERFSSLKAHESDLNRKYGRTYLGVGIIDPAAYTNLRFTYERRFGAGSFGLYIPLTIGLGDKEFVYNERNINYRIGVGFNFHVPRKQGNSFYVIGMGIYGGSLNRHDYGYNGEPQNTSQAFFTITNSHSVRIRINKRLIFAPGIDFHLIGSSEYGMSLFVPFFRGLRLDILFNL